LTVSSRFGSAAPLLLATLLAACSALPPQSAAEPAMPSNYGVLVANALKPYQDFGRYSNFEISGLRWVHAETGWNWLACLRYDDNGHRRIYSLFFAGGAVVNARYDIVTDRCGVQQYLPFDLATGTIGTPSVPVQQPIY
jgi:hypothetical protein